MRLEQTSWAEARGWTPGRPGALGEAARLVFVFANPPLFKQQRVLAEIRTTYPRAHLLGCSTAGTICGARVVDDALVATAVAFEYTEIKGARVPIAATEQSYEAGERLARALPLDGLVHVFVLSEGIQVNGSELVRGLTANLPRRVAVTGGLSGDDDRFGETYVLWDDAPETSAVAAVGLYGERLRVGYGSRGGWDPAGLERLITRAKGNVLYELEGQPALRLYQLHLGEHAAGLPAAGLL